jgi:hypothetical protein
MLVASMSIHMHYCIYEDRADTSYTIFVNTDEWESNLISNSVKNSQADQSCSAFVKRRHKQFNPNLTLTILGSPR